MQVASEAPPRARACVCVHHVKGVKGVKGVLHSEERERDPSSHPLHALVVCTVHHRLMERTHCLWSAPLGLQPAVSSLENAVHCERPGVALLSRP